MQQTPKLQNSIYFPCYFFFFNLYSQWHKLNHDVSELTIRYRRPFEGFESGVGVAMSRRYGYRGRKRVYGLAPLPRPRWRLVPMTRQRHFWEAPPPCSTSPILWAHSHSRSRARENTFNRQRQRQQRKCERWKLKSERQAVDGVRRRSSRWRKRHCWVHWGWGFLALDQPQMKTLCCYQPISKFLTIYLSQLTMIYYLCIHFGMNVKKDLILS